MRSLLARYELRFSVARLWLRHFFVEVMAVLRKVWLVCLSIITAAFILWLVYESIQYRREYPLSFMTDQEVEELVEQDYMRWLEEQGGDDSDGRPRGNDANAHG